ncbi:MAG: coproporphyrinogen III oxidase family protein, partial [Bacteroidales bacterium]|nr:coproporphyrinogen III oxidase family protein [Bacteroidales bacterium]
GILDWRPEHISAYQLSVEEGSAVGRMAREGRYSELPDEECSAQYYLVCRLLAEAGYEHYEISNWALPGRRAVHNSAYWTRAPYVGLGPGAHSLQRNPDIRSWNSEALSGWTVSREVLSAAEIREEQIMLGLRTADGVRAELLPGSREGLVPAAEPGCLRIPEERWFVADDIISGLI